MRIAITGGTGFIGTNMIEQLLREGVEDILSLDLVPPKDLSHERFWSRCDILDKDAVRDLLAEFGPTHIIHLAGRTDMDGISADDYAANHVGTKNIISAVQSLAGVERIVFTSSQFVVGPGVLPSGDTDFRPHTVYGHSKVLSEQAVRSADLSCIWTIVRPTNVWGKWHPRYPKEFWRVLKQGRYVHPGGRGVTRCYAYIRNVTDQIWRILNAPPAAVDREVFYVGDAPIDIWDWTNAFSMELVGKPVRVVPRPVIRAIATVGDGIIAIGGKFPIFTSRYKSMTQDYVTPMSKTFERLGVPRVGLNDGVKETVAWLRSQGEFWQ